MILYFLNESFFKERCIYTYFKGANIKNKTNETKKQKNLV